MHMRFGFFLVLIAGFSSAVFAFCPLREFSLVFKDYLDLSRINKQIENRSNGIAGLYQRGVIKDDPEPVYAVRAGVPDPDQPLGFRRVLLPFARTGIYVPTEVDLRNPESIGGYDGYILVLPGIGTDRSDATTLFTLAQTLNSGKDSALKAETRPEKLRLLPILLDATLNGMGKDAPFYFGDHAEAVEIIRHARLILQLAFSNFPCFLAGRSQGGLMAMEYAEWFGDIAGVVAVNPSPTRPDLHESALELGVQNLSTIMDSPTQLNRSFYSYQGHTTNYVGFGTHSFWHRTHRFLIRHRNGTAPAAVPTLILVGTQDKGYPPEYIEYVKQFVLENPSCELEFFDGPHDLWNRRDKALYRAVISRMARFMTGNLTELD